MARYKRGEKGDGAQQQWSFCPPAIGCPDPTYSAPHSRLSSEILRMLDHINGFQNFESDTDNKRCRDPTYSGNRTTVNSGNHIKFIKDLECDTDIKRSPNLSFRVKSVHPDVVWPGWLVGDAIGTDQL